MNEAASHHESAHRRLFRLLKPREVAEAMNVSVDTVYRMAQDGAIPGAGHVRGQLRIEEAPFLEWWEHQKRAFR